MRGKWVRPVEVGALREVTQGALERAVFEVLAGLGLRRAEVPGLRRTDLDWGEPRVYITGEGPKERLIPVADPASEAVEAYLAERPPPAPVGARGFPTATGVR